MYSVRPQTAAIRRMNQEYVNIIHTCTCKLEIALDKQTRCYNGTLLIHYNGIKRKWQYAVKSHWLPQKFALCLRGFSTC